MKEIIQKTREYLDYIEEHYGNVQKAWKILQGKCEHMAFIYDDFDFDYNAINESIKQHDKSKLGFAEFQAYRMKFYPSIGEDKEIAEIEFKRAWKSHLTHNPHHWENWTYIHEKYHIQKYNCMIEMICDWMAMGMKFGDTAKDYYEKNEHKIIIPEPYKTRMYEIFDIV